MMSGMGGGGHEVAKIASTSRSNGDATCDHDMEQVKGSSHSTMGDTPSGRRCKKCGYFEEN